MTRVEGLSAETRELYQKRKDPDALAYDQANPDEPPTDMPDDAANFVSPNRDHSKLAVIEEAVDEMHGKKPNSGMDDADFGLSEIKGTVVSYVGEDGVELGGNGFVSVSVELIPGFLSFGFPLGSASAGVRLLADEQASYFSGINHPDLSFLPPQIPFVPAQTLEGGGLRQPAASGGVVHRRRRGLRLRPLRPARGDGSATQ